MENEQPGRQAASEDHEVIREGFYRPDKREIIRIFAWTLADGTYRIKVNVFDHCLTFFNDAPADWREKILEVVKEAIENSEKHPEAIAAISGK